MEEDKFELVAKGSNSEIVLYDEIVLKMVDVKYGKHTRHLQNQYRIIKRLDHPNVISCIGYKKAVRLATCGVVPEGTRDVLMLQHADQGSLLSYIKQNRLNGQEKIRFIRQICDALYYLHIIQHVAHRDIKLDNILVKSDSEGKPATLLSDFGFAIRGDSQKPDLTAHSCKGTRRGYMSPQLHNLSQKPQPYEARKLDIFSFGVVIFALMFSKLPFEFATPTDKYFSSIYNKQYNQFWQKHKISDETWKQIGLQEDLKQLLQNMWKVNPSQRYTIEQVRESAWLNYSFK